MSLIYVILKIIAYLIASIWTSIPCFTFLEPQYIFDYIHNINPKNAHGFVCTKQILLSFVKRFFF